jgi:hypothetical protein
MPDDLWQLDASELARLIRFGRISSREATESCLARLDAVNPEINAVVRVRAEEALAAAGAADEARAQGYFGSAARRVGHDQDQHRPGRLSDRQKQGGVLRIGTFLGHSPDPRSSSC